MKRVTLPWEEHLGYPTSDAQVLQSTVAGVRSWGGFVFQKGTYAERIAIAAPQKLDLFLQTDNSGTVVDGVDQDPAGPYFFYNAWTPITSMHSAIIDQFYPAAVYLIGSDTAAPQFGFLPAR